jgi:hypothetical protein
MIWPRVSIRRGDRGAVLVHVAAILVGLVAISALSVDYGVMWMSRRQAQNAADSAALAGAMSLAYDDPNDFERARVNAKALGETHTVFGQAPDITLGAGLGSSQNTANDISFPPCPPSAPGLPDTCVRVNVYRAPALNGADVQAKDPLPMFFGPLFGRTEQGVRATATAQILSGNASECLKPWAVADRWTENVRRACTNPPCSTFNWEADNTHTWDFNDTFDRFARNQGTWAVDPTIAPNTPDVYVPPTLDANGYPVAGSGSGFGLYNADGSLRDYGQILALKIGQGNNANAPISAGWFQALDLPCVAAGCPTNSGLNKYAYNITNCSGVALGIGDTIPVQTGVGTGPTDQSVYDAVGQASDSLYERDPGASWDVASQSVTGSCAPGVCADGRYYTTSPRIVPVSLFNVQSYLETNPTGSGGSVTITNIFGFFILGQTQAATLGLTTGPGNTGAEVYGVMMSVPGLAQGTSTNPVTSSFLRTVILVQ